MNNAKRLIEQANNESWLSTEQQRKTEPQETLMQKISLGHKPLFEIKKELDRFYKGHEIEKVLLFTVLCSHKTNHPIHTILVGESSAGKSKALETCIEYMPKSAFLTKKKMLASISRKALTRFKSKEMQEQNETWDNKILAVLELDGTMEASETMRTLMSEGGAETLVTEKTGGANYTQEWTIEGKPLTITTSANDKIEKQFANRCFVILIEAKEEDIRNTLEFLGEKAVFNEKKEPNFKIKNFVEYLKSMPVATPYANEIAKVFPKDLPRANRDIQSVYSLIRTICLIHQQNRKVITKEKDGFTEQWLVANADDYEIARQLLTSIFKTTISGGLSAREKEFLDAVIKKSNTKEIQTAHTVKGVTQNEIENELGVNSENAYKFLNQLVDKSLLKAHRIYDGSTKKPNIYEPKQIVLQNKFLPPFFELIGGKEKTYLNGRSWLFQKEHFELVEDTIGVPLFNSPYNFVTGKEWDLLGYE